MKPYLLFVFVLLMMFEAKAQYSNQLTTNIQDVTFGAQNSYDVVRLSSPHVLTDLIGKPQVPVVVKRYVLPADAYVTGLSINSYNRVELTGTFDLLPAQYINIPDGRLPYPFVPPDTSVYLHSNPFPGKIAEISSQGYWFGYKLVTIRFYPVEFIPSDRKLYLYQSITFTINYTSASVPEPPPMTISTARKQMILDMMFEVVENDADLVTVTGGINNTPVDDASVAFLLNDQFPCSIGAIPDYLIITTRELRSHFQDFIDWKNKKGIPTAIATIEDDIIGKIPGCDSADQIRNFIIQFTNAYGQGMFVLLGGDVNLIPSRFTPAYGYTDYYYATTGNWNINGDYIFNDIIDDDPVNMVGRIPVQNPDDVQNYYTRTYDYEHIIHNNSPVSPNFLKRLLVLTGSTAIGNTAWRDSTEVQTANTGNVPASITRYRLYDTQTYNEPLHASSAIENLNKDGSEGFNLVLHFDHSGPMTMGSSVVYHGEKLHNYNVDSLVNDSSKYYLYSLGCQINKFSQNSISKRFINNRKGGAVIFIGKTVSVGDSPDIFGKFCKIFYTDNKLSRNHAGYAFIQSLIGSNGSGHYNRPDFTLLGDPELPMWGAWGTAASPPQLTIVAPPDSLVTGTQQLSVTIGNLTPGLNFRICISKNNEIYIHKDTTATGTTMTCAWPVNARTDGAIEVCLTAKNHKPTVYRIIVVNNPGANLYVGKISITDTIFSANSNNDGVADAGELFDLDLSINNSGLSVSPAIYTDSLIAKSIGMPFAYVMNNGSVVIPPVSPQTPATTSPPYRIQLSPNCADGRTQYFYLKMPMMPTYPNCVDTFSITVHAPVLSIYSVRFTETNANSALSDNGAIDAGDTVFLYINIENRGTGRANNLLGILSLDSANGFIYIDSTYKQIGTIFSNTMSENVTAYRFRVSPAWDGSPFYLHYTLAPDNSFGKDWNFHLIDLRAPTQQITGIGFESDYQRIKLHWQPVSQVRGYNVYRCATENGTFVKINDRIIEHYAFIDDYPLPENTVYFYKIATVSAFGIEGPKCSPFKAWTTLKPRDGWPVTKLHPDYGTQTQGSPMTEDVDNDLKKEIFLTIGEDTEGRSGALLAFNTDGTEYRDYDHNPDFYGGFYQFENATSSCTPAIADINADGSKEIIVTTRENHVPPATDDKGKVFVFSGTASDSLNNPDTLWTRLVTSDLRGGVLFAGPETDTVLKLAIKGNWEANPYILDGATGNPLAGWPRYADHLAGSSIPVLADLDGDGAREFIAGFGNVYHFDANNQPVCDKPAGLYIWNYDGSSYGQQDTSGLFYYHKSNGSTFNDQIDSPPVVARVIADSGSFRPGIITITAGYSIDIFGVHNEMGHVIVIDPLTGDTTAGWSYDDADHRVQLSPSEGAILLPAVSVGDVNDDMVPEIFVAGHHQIYGWAAGGITLPNFPIAVDSLETRFIGPLLADVDGDGDIEILVASNSDKGGVYAFHIDTGQPVTGWPLNTGKIAATPCIDDIDLDGKNEIIAASGPTIHVYNTEGRSDRVIWGKYRLNHYNNAVYNQPCEFTATPLYVTGNTTWFNETANSDIIVQPGAKLTVKGTLTMPLQARIIVKAGAGNSGGGKLFVNGGTITTHCQGLWKGIEVWGNPNVSQTTTTSSGALIQGQVYLYHGGSVMNAEIGILASARSIDQNEEDPYGYAGGIVSADSAFFVNNRIAVQIDPYSYYNYARFKRTHFTTTAMLGDSALPDCFVQAINAGPVTFNGSTFRNTRPDTTVYYENRGRGIFSQNAELYFDTYCLSTSLPCQAEEPCVFEKLTRGIYAMNAAGAADIHLSKTQFFDNIYGAYFSGYTSVAYLQILSNTFRNGPPYPTYGYGLYLDQCTGFHVEDNEFYQEHAELKGIGLVVNNSDTLPNEVYRNRFHHLKYATLSQNENSNYNPPLHLGGLCYKCNKFVKDDLSEPNLFDFAITYDQSFNNQTGIARNQGAYLSGSSFAPVGNMFQPNPATSHYDFYNEGNDIDYYYHLQNQTYFRLQPQPQNIYGTVRTHPVNEDFIDSSSCPSTLSGSGSSEELDQMIMAQSQSDSLGDALISLVDGGSTEILNLEVQISTPPEALQVRNELLNESPYLSDTVMKTSVTKEDVLDNAMIRDVLVANPQSAKSEIIMNMLEYRTVPMPDYMMEQILAGEDTVGAKETLQARKAWLDKEATKAYTRLLDHYQGNGVDSLMTDSLMWLFDYHNTLSSRYDKANWLLAHGEYDQAAEELLSIPASFNLNTVQTSTHQAYQELYGALKTIRSDTLYAFRVDSIQANLLQSIMQSNQDLPGAYARNILLAAREIIYHEPVILPDTGLKMIKKDKFRGVKESDNSKAFIVFPNPADDYFIIKLNLPEEANNIVIKLFDCAGNLAQPIKFQNQKDQLVIPASNLKTGIYLLELCLNGRNAYSVKLAVFH